MGHQIKRETKIREARIKEEWEYETRGQTQF